jgi:hypothetical protein
MYMKRLAIYITILFLIATAFAYSTDSSLLEKPFVPVSPQIMGQGGAFIADAHGYNALFYNPAGFARSDGSLTISDTTAWVYANPARFMDSIGNAGTEEMTNFVNQEITTGGLGYGFSQGIGYVGGGLGLGVAFIMDSYLYGPTALGAQGDITFTLGFIAGLGVPIDLLGINFNLGADIRPMIRLHAPFDHKTALDLLNAAMSGGDLLASFGGVDAMHGFGLGLDLGAIAELGNLNVGLSIRDFLGTSFKYTENSFETIMDSLGSSGSFPDSGTEVTKDYHIPMDVGVGVAYYPDWGLIDAIIEPSFYADLQDVIGVIRDKRSPWALLHLGTKVKMLSFLTLRAGLNQGYITLGGGIELLFLDLNFALFTREMGKHLGDRPNSGITIEGAIRF